jgi:2-polyprenyl-3-methyl-5-hydroxy-6-metoxy-1,4-benzoquinol methylase
MIDGCVDLNSCVVCDDKKIKLVLNLGDQPLANNFLDTPKIETFFPLRINACSSCFHLQLSHSVSGNLLYKNYLYRSGTTNTYKKYMEWFALNSLKYFKIKPNNVLDIGCNDGTQLDFYKHIGLETYGIDPAENLYQYSSKNHMIKKDFFTHEINFNKKFDIVIMQNSFAHQPNPKKFLRDIKKNMSDNSLLFLQTSQADMIKNNEFDTIYHEHVNFYCTNSMNTLVEKCGLYIRDIFKNDIHGTSYIFVITKNVMDRNMSCIKQFLEEENKVNTIENYHGWAEKVLKIKDDYCKVIDDRRHTRLVGYGAAAKGNTFINFVKKPLDVIIDDNELKQGKYSPGSHIPVVSIKYLENISIEDNVTFVPLAWNFFSEIKSRIQTVRKSTKDKFLKYFPKVEIE